MIISKETRSMHFVSLNINYKWQSKVLNVQNIFWDMWNLVYRVSNQRHFNSDVNVILSEK